jgi:hypothetical protein
MTNKERPIVPAVKISVIVSGGTIPIELYVVRLEINLFPRSIKSWIGKGECYHCRKGGYIRG